MHANQAYKKGVTVNNGSDKWWHRRWVKITGISVIVLIIVAVILALVLIFVVFAPKKSETPQSGKLHSNVFRSSSMVPLNQV
ncbi:unnamed protein product [Adineta steineri]|uniref:Uncharacterized protein n=1 Tax=Adineta steineri TaxID=433720 RepID=A0A820G4G8_9BILA|nr:unnamed protein product [Adineta steineri]CAF4270952.1 unnamed protein product [Adineta steineri]